MYKSVVGDNVWVRNLVEQVMGSLDAGFLGIGFNDGIEGKDVWVVYGFKGMLSSTKASALRV